MSGWAYLILAVCAVVIAGCFGACLYAELEARGVLNQERDVA